MFSEPFTSPPSILLKKSADSHFIWKSLYGCCGSNMIISWPSDPMIDGSSDSHHLKVVNTSSETKFQVPCKVSKRGASKGKRYTSKYRGVHQTFPTQRWEAQFRRQGKPTSLGCFDEEEGAARAYDRMMIWCELHSFQSCTDIKDATTHLSSIALNFHYLEYEEDIDALQQISQEELIRELRKQGRTLQNSKHDK
jgi:L-rhamnose mutarotase